MIDYTTQDFHEVQQRKRDCFKKHCYMGKKTPQGTKNFPFKKRVPANITAKELLGLAHGNTYKLIQSH